MFFTIDELLSSSWGESFMHLWKPVFVPISQKYRRWEGMLLTELGLTDVDQHVCVGAVAHWEVIVMSTVVVLYGLFLGAPWHHVIIKLAPLESERQSDGRQGGGWWRNEDEEWGKWARKPSKEMGEKEKTREHLRRPYVANHLDTLWMNSNINMQSMILKNVH